MRMRTMAVAAVVSLALPALGLAQEEGGQAGVGAYVGTPFGFTAKYLFDRSTAADFALGEQGGSLDIHFDGLFHFRDLPKQPPVGKLAPYIGMGLKVKDQDDTLVGIRFVCGTAYLIKNTPLEAFAEIVPVLRAMPSWGSNLDGGIGLRYYFGLSPRK